MTTVEIRMSKGKTMISLVALSLMGIAGIALAYLSYANNWTFFFGHFSIWMGIFIFMFVMSFGAAIWMYKKSNDPKPILIISEEGIMENASFLKGRLIKWNEIRSAEVKSIYGSKQILIFLNDPESFLSGFSGMKKTMLASNYKQQGTPVMLAAQSYDYNFDELLALLKSKIN